VTRVFLSDDAIHAMNDGIFELFDAINADPIVEAKTRIGIVAFSDTARVLVPLGRVSELATIPPCLASGAGAHFGNLFRLLSFVIPRDLRSLTRTARLHPPLVFIMTPGRPVDDDWPSMKNKFLDSVKKWRLRVVPFGIDHAERHAITELAHWPGSKIYFMAEDGGTRGAILEILKGYFSGPVESGGTGPEFEVPPGQRNQTVFVMDRLGPSFEPESGA
jgi:uncharacterized protein YegL